MGLGHLFRERPVSMLHVRPGPQADSMSVGCGHLLRERADSLPHQLGGKQPILEA